MRDFHCESFDETGRRFGGFVVAGETMGEALAKAATNGEVQTRPDMVELRVTDLELQLRRRQTPESVRERWNVAMENQIARGAVYVSVPKALAEEVAELLRTGGPSV